MMFLLKQRLQYGKQLVGQLIAFPIVVVPDLLILQVEIIVFLGALVFQIVHLVVKQVFLSVLWLLRRIDLMTQSAVI